MGRKESNQTNKHCWKSHVAAQIYNLINDSKSTKHTKELGRCMRKPVLRLSDQADSCQSAQLHKPGGHISILENRERNDTSKAVEIKCADHPAQ